MRERERAYRLTEKISGATDLVCSAVKDQTQRDGSLHNVNESEEQLPHTHRKVCKAALFMKCFLRRRQSEDGDNLICKGGGFPAEYKEPSFISNLSVSFLVVSNFILCDISTERKHCHTQT